MIQFVVKPFLDEISKMKFREKVMGELVGIVPRKLDVSTLLISFENMQILRMKKL